MKKYNRLSYKHNALVVLLAYFHRYGYFFLMIFLGFAIPIKSAAIIAAMIMFYGLYTIVGTFLGFRHLYCSMQECDHLKMTPSIRRYQLTSKMKKELFGIGGIFTFLGLALMVIRIFFPGR